MSKNSFEWKTLFWAILFSIVLSCVFLVARVDHDFFSYYYVGRNVFGGGAMYQDAYANKGPVLYWFFALLYGIFGNRYDLALIIGGGFLDGITIWLGWRLLRIWWDENANQKFGGRVIIALALTSLIYKGLVIGMFGGGIYSENLAMFWLTISLLAWEKKKPFVSGGSFVMAILTRQTMFFFLPIFWIRREAHRGLWRWIGGMVVIGIGVASVLMQKQSLGGVMKYAVLWNVSYASSVSQSYIYNLWFRLSSEPLVLTLTGLILVLAGGLLADRKIPKGKRRLVGWLGVSSVLATWAGGYFFGHHFLQMMLFWGYLMGYFPVIRIGKGAVKVALWGVLLGLILSYGYIWVYRKDGLVNFVNGLGYLPPEFGNVRSAKYLTVVPYWAKLYFDYQKHAPDRYFDQYLLLDFFNSDQSQIEGEEHLSLASGVLRQTAFLMIVTNDTDRRLVEEYKSRYGEKFGLMKTREYRQQNLLIEEYIPAGFVK